MASPDRDKAIRIALLNWFDAGKRDLPWRNTKDSYAVLVSEFMLQQTRIDTALSYYLRWMERFPTLQSLADAEVDEALRLWSGLGYYARARNLHRLSVEVTRNRGGELPSDPKDLQALPGVGDYTAAAVASIVFGVPVPAIDANAVRVLSRIDAVAGNPKSAKTADRLRRCSLRLMDVKHPGDFNQAVMELGALVCSPARPDCGHCPVSRWCAAHLAGREIRYPSPEPRKETIKLEAVAAVVRWRGKVLLRRRPEGAPMAGLWELPGGSLTHGKAPESAARNYVREQTFVSTDRPDEIFAVDHSFTHHRIRIHVLVCGFRAQTNSKAAKNASVRWVEWSDPGDVALTGATKKILKRLKMS